MPQRTAAPPVPLHADRPTPAARDDRRAVREAARSRRRAEAEERRGVRSVQTVRRRRAVTAVAGAVLVLLVGLPLLLAFGPVFPVRTIAVTGASGPLAGQVRTALQAELGRPVALVGERDVEAALARVPAVERFTLVRRPPNTLQVAVVPRTPVLQQRTAAGWRTLDAARVVLATSPSRAAGLPVLTIPSAAPRSAYASAVSAVQALGAAPAVTAVRAASADDVVLTLQGGLRVRWGGAEGGAAKAEALRAALRSAARGATEVDVSSPGVVLTR